MAQADEACAGRIRPVHGGLRDQVLQPRGRAARAARQPDTPALPVLALQVRQHSAVTVSLLSAYILPVPAMDPCARAPYARRRRPQLRRV